MRLIAFDWGHTLMNERLTGALLMPDVRETLPLLPLPLAVWANTRTAREREVRDWLARGGIDKYFAWVVTSVDAGVRKPAAGFFEFALARCGVPKEQVLFVGNQLNTDVAGGEGFGIRTVLVTGPDYRSEDDDALERCVPSYTIERLRELPELVQVLLCDSLPPSRPAGTPHDDTT